MLVFSRLNKLRNDANEDENCATNQIELDLSDDLIEEEIEVESKKHLVNDEN